jgi:DNA-directed RNA polymerase specialized sigma subunit
MSPEKIIKNQFDLDYAAKLYLESGSAEAKAGLIRLGRKMATYYAGIYSTGKVDKVLEQAAGEGFDLALKRYDPSCDVTFTRYATHYIISEIRQELRARQLFKIPVWLKNLQDNVIAATEELADNSSAFPALEDIAKKINIAENGIAEVMQAGNVSLEEIQVSEIKNKRLESFKLPIEDVISIRKSLDRLGDIQKKVLSLISVNLRELSLAIEEEELALTKAQIKNLRFVESCSGNGEWQEDTGKFRFDFPEEFVEEDVRCYFEVLADEFGLYLAEIPFISGPSKAEGENYSSVSMEIVLEGRYRGLLQLLDHLRHEEKAVQVEKVQAVRNENIPARICIMVEINTFYRDNGFER